MRKTSIRITAIILALAMILTFGAALYANATRAQEDFGDTGAVYNIDEAAAPDGAAYSEAPAKEKSRAVRLSAQRAFRQVPGDERPVLTAAGPDEPSASAGDSAPDGAAEHAQGESDASAETAADPASTSTALPPDAETVDTPAPDTSCGGTDDRYASLALSDGDLEILARLVYLEARGEPYEGQVAVAEVVLNRVLSDRFPDTVEEVVYQTGQFTPAALIESTTPGEEQYEAVADAVDGTECVTGADVVFFSGAPYNDQVYAVIGNHYFCEL